MHKYKEGVVGANIGVGLRGQGRAIRAFSSFFVSRQPVHLTPRASFYCL